MNKITTLTGILVLAFTVSAEATVIYAGGQISQITDVAVTAVNADWGSTGPSDPRTVHFNVDFVYGTYVDVFGGSALPPGWQITSLGLATAATYGLADALAGTSATDVFAGGNGEPWVPFYVGEIFSATGYCANCVQARGVFYWPSPHTVGWFPDLSTPRIQLDESRTWAIFSEVTAVPVPAAIWLMATGLISLISIARRKRI